MAYVTDRSFGGLGFALTGPSTQVDWRGERGLALEGYSREEEAAVLAALTRLEERTGSRLSGRYQKVRGPEAHIGLGSKTSVVLATLALAGNACGVPVSDSDLWITSGRGGASSIGFSGFVGRQGLLVDPGRANSERMPLLPSSIARPPLQPVMAESVAIPRHWRIFLMLPQGKRVSGRAELALFRANTPMAADDVRFVIHAKERFIAAARTGDLERVADACTQLGAHGFKRLEIDNQAPDVRRTIELVRERTGLPVGMSSVGPTVFVLFRDGTDDPSFIAHLAQSCGCEILGSWSISAAETSHC